MKVKELIEILKVLDQEAIVVWKLFPYHKNESMTEVLYVASTDNLVKLGSEK